MMFGLVCVTYFINKTSKFVLLFGRIVSMLFLSRWCLVIFSLPALILVLPRPPSKDPPFLWKSNNLSSRKQDETGRI